MHREESEIVRQLYRLFLVYERVEALAAAGELPAAEQAELVPVLGELSFACWRAVFGPVLEQAPHRRFVLGWCLRNAELLMKEEVLPVIAHQVIATHIQHQAASLPESDAAYDFSQEGPQGPAGTALRRVYLIQSLTIQLDHLADGGQIPARLQAHLRQHLVARVKGLFVQTLGEPDELTLAGRNALSALLEQFRMQGLLTAPMVARLEDVASRGVPTGSAPRPSAWSSAGGSSTAIPRASAGSLVGMTRPELSRSDSGVRPRPELSRSDSGVRPHPAPSLADSGVAPRPVLAGDSGVAARPESSLSASAVGLTRPVDPSSNSGARATLAAPPELVELAAAGELVRRLRRQASLSMEDRDRLIKRIETEMEDLLEQLGARRLDRALGELGERLGIPVPPRTPSSAGGMNSGSRQAVAVAPVGPAAPGGAAIGAAIGAPGRAPSGTPTGAPGGAPVADSGAAPVPASGAASAPASVAAAAAAPGPGTVPAAEDSAARLLPTSRSPATSSGRDRISPDSSDYQWAFDLIEDLRRENVEPEGSSGK